MAHPQTKQAPKLGMIRGKGTTISDSIPAKLSTDEVVLNAGAAKALKNMLGDMTIDQFNAKYAPEGAKTEIKNGVMHAAFGVDDEMLKRLQSASAPTVENAASLAQTQRSNDNPPVTPINTTYPAYSGQNALVGGSDMNKLANNVVAPIAKGSEALMRGVAGLIPNEAEKAARHAVLADKANQVKEAVTQTAGQIPEFLIGRGGVEAGRNIGNAVIGTGQGMVRNAQADIANNQYGVTGVPYSLAKGAATRLYDTMTGDQNTPLTVQKPVITPQTQQLPSIQKQVTESLQDQPTEQQKTGNATYTPPRLKNSIASDAWNQGGAGNMERQSKVIAPGLLPANTAGTYDEQSGQRYVLGANGQQQWLPPRDEFAPKGTMQQKIYLAGLTPAEREARGDYANVQQASGNPDQEAASQHYLLGNQGRNSPVLDLTGGRRPPNDSVGANGRRLQPLKVTPWDNPMTDANMQEFTPEYINAVTNAREQKANQEADKEANAIDKQYKLGMVNRKQVNKEDNEPAFKAEDLEMLADTSNTERARIKTLKKAHMAALQDALANGTPEEEGSILREFSQASGISMKTLQEMLRR